MPRLSKELDYAKALPMIYAYIGIDYLLAFYRKRKVRPILSIIKIQPFMDAFMALGNLDLLEKIIADIEEFPCHMCSYPKNKCIYGVLKTEFDKKWNPKPGKNPLDCMKSVDPKTLPPYS